MKHTLDPVSIIDRGKLPAEAGSFLRKHRVDGRAIHNDDHITVEVESFDGFYESTIRACIGHEVGHSIMLRTIEQADMLKLDRFTSEVDAWHRFTWDAGNVPQDLTTGMLILDALNSYRRGYNVPDERWEQVRTMVCTWSVDSETLADYVPLEPDPGEPAPGGCGGEPGQPGGLGTPSDGDVDGEGEETDEEADDDEGNGRDEGKGEGESDTDTSTGEGTAPNDDDEGNTKGRDGTDGTGGYGDGGTSDEDEESDEEPEDEDAYGDAWERREERDRWLHKQEGLDAAKQGRTYLTEVLATRGWDASELPQITEAVITANQ